ncbi:MAG: YihY/virulence factor BrkB family protein, partial [Spirochaetaceae bacterium]|nr:YihY/virulence factor BrkB family protein [Spirochaetaceae bacterium]
MEQQNPSSSKTKRYTLRTFVQETFLTGNFFIQNDLITYASACAFSFLFSLLPVVIMCAVILIRVLKASPSVLNNLYQFDTELSQIFDVSHLVNSVLDFQGGIIFNIVVGVFIFWMARRLFNSTMKGIGCIFHKELVVRPLVSQLIIVAGEVLLVVVIALTIFVLTSGRTLLETSFLQELIPPVIIAQSNRLVRFLPATLMFGFVTICFKVATRTRPRWKHCILAAAACTVTFFAFSFFSTMLRNTTTYNMIYGVMSSIIILLLKVFVFFILFLFFAQALFVHQFFDQLLLGELYLLPGRDETQLHLVLRRLLFIDPDYFILRMAAATDYKSGEMIYQEGDQGEWVYFLAQGQVQITGKHHILQCHPGDFFGELPCILGRSREESAMAETQVQV